jgi:hypothetical protein
VLALLYWFVRVGAQPAGCVQGDPPAAGDVGATGKHPCNTTHLFFEVKCFFEVIHLQGRNQATRRFTFQLEIF